MNNEQKKRLGESVFVISQELDRIAELHEEVKDESQDNAGLFIMFTDFSMMHSKIKNISKFFFKKEIDIVERAKKTLD